MSAATTIIFFLFLLLIDLTVIVLFMRRILDALHTLIAQGSKRRDWRNTNDDS